MKKNNLEEMFKGAKFIDNSGDVILGISILISVVSVMFTFGLESSLPFIWGMSLLFSAFLVYVLFRGLSIIIYLLIDIRDENFIQEYETNKEIEKQKVVDLP